MALENPHVVIVAGPNGAGKSTTAPELLRGALKVSEFVNADVIASGLSAFRSDRVAIQAGRILRGRIDALARAGEDFAFETTLASRTVGRWIESLTAAGYESHLLFFFLRSADAAVERVAERVRRGGHDVPERTVRRRYDRGLKNFFRIYRTRVTRWRFYDNSESVGPRLIALGGKGMETLVHRAETWDGLMVEYENE